MVRVSGPQAIDIVARCWQGASLHNMSSHTAHLGHITDSQGRLLDEVVLTEIYPAREEPIEGVTSQLIYDNLKPGVHKTLIRKDDVLDYVGSHDFEVLIVLGAGDLDNQVPQIAKILEAKIK